MPELPDVETFRRYFETVATGKRVDVVEVRSPRILDSISAADFVQKVTGTTFGETTRIGKHLLCRLDQNLWLTLHFGMSGFLRFFTDAVEEPGHVRVLFTLADGSLAYDNKRMIGKVGLVQSPADLVAQKHLGPDALEIGRAAFVEGLSTRKGHIKTVLMDQSFIAGIGNVYADEILFQAGVHPYAEASALDAATAGRMFDFMGGVLKTAVDRHAVVEDLPPEFLLPHRQKNGTCPVCGNPFTMVKIGGRTTYFCASCQELP